MKLLTKKKFALSVTLVCVSVLLLAIWFFVRSLNGPSTGKISISPSGAHIVTSKTAPQGSYNGRLIRFDYPTGYQKASSGLSGNYLEVHHVYAGGHSGRDITLGVIRESLDADSGVQYRRSHPEIYQLQNSPANSLVFFSKQNGFERTVFITHNGLVLSIAAVDANGYDMTADQNHIINSLQWK